MKYLLLLLLAVPAAIGQTGTASIQGMVLDGKTQKPVPAAWVIANRAGGPPFAKNTKSGGDGAFQIQGLTAGTYSLCVQVEGDQYLNPCQWSDNPTTVMLTSAQAASAISLRVAAASLLTIQLRDPQKLLSQNTKDGRRPDLIIGVFGPKGLFYPAHRSGSSTAVAGLPGAINAVALSSADMLRLLGQTYTYRLAVPRDTALTLQIASHDLKLGDSAGAALPPTASNQAFQHATGDPKPKTFEFTVLSLLP